MENQILVVGKSFLASALTVASIVATLSLCGCSKNDEQVDSQCRQIFFSQLPLIARQESQLGTEQGSAQLAASKVSALSLDAAVFGPDDNDEILSRELIDAFDHFHDSIERDDFEDRLGIEPAHDIVRGYFRQEFDDFEFDDFNDWRAPLPDLPRFPGNSDSDDSD